MSSLRHSATALTVLVLGSIGAVGQTTYRDVPLDCGGWVSGFAQHSSGRLYGYGDIFGLYRSDDFGATWRFLQAGLTDPGNITFVSGVTVHPLDANRVAYMAAARVWTSADGGDSWTTRLTDVSKNTLDRGTKPIAYHPTQANQLWLAANRSGQTSSLWRSTDNGVSWSASGGTAFVNERAVTIHFFPSAPNEIWVGTDAISGLSTLGGLWCSVNGGTTWTKVWNNGGAQTENYGTPAVNSIARNAARVSVFSSNDGVWQVTATDWNNPATYIATQRTWNGQNIPNVTALANGSFWASEIGDQTWAPKVSTDGVTWTDRQITLTAAYVPEWASAAQITSANRVYGRDMMVQDVANPNRWLLTGGGSAHLSEDNGLTWRYQPGGMAGIASHRVNFDRLNPLRAYIATADRGIFIVTDGGLSGTTSTSSRKTFDELHNFHEVMVSADGQTIVGAGVQQSLNQTVIIRSTNGGSTWAKVTPAGLPASYEGITRAVMSLNNPNDYLVLLGYTDKAGQANNPGLYRTTDGGANFTKVGGTSFDGINTGMRYAAELARLERDGINPNTRYLCLRADNNSFARGVWRSTDGGTTWVLRTDPFGGAWTWALAVDPTVEGRLWAGAHSLRRSDDGGGTWTTVSNFVDIDSLDAYAGRLAIFGRRSGDTFNKIYASADNGNTWQEQTGPTNRLLWANREISLDPWRANQIWVTSSRSVQLINPPTGLDPLLIGTITGSAPAGGNASFAASMAYDGNTATAFSPASNGGNTTLDLGVGVSARITSIRYFPRAGFESRMNGGRFEGSPDGTNWTTLASLSATPSAGWQTVSVSQTAYFRHLRYLHPTGQADVAEIEFRGLLATTPAILNQPLPALSTLVGQAVNYSLTASGTPLPTFSIIAGTLPAGLSINATTGTISGTPTAATTGTVTVQASNSKGNATATISYSIVLGARISASTPAPSFTQTTNTTGTAPVTLTNTGDAPLSWAASLPTVDGNYTQAASTKPGSGISYSWINAVAGGTKVALADGDETNAGPIPLPFNFPFYGTDRTSLRVCTNGFISFTNTGSPWTPPTSLPSTSTNAPENLIAPFYTDLFVRFDSGIYYRAVDSQSFAISFVDLVRYADRGSSNPQRYNFQAILKSDGRILFQYQNVPNLSTGSQLIGIQNSTRTLGSTITIPSPTNSLNGQAYQFTPPLGWLAAISPNSSSAAGTTLAAGASVALNATINTTGIATGQTRSGNITFTSNDPINPVLAVLFNLTVGTPATPPPVIASGQSASGTVGIVFSYALQATNTPTSYTLASGTLPPGISLNSSTGQLTGTPTTAGTHTPAFTATNAGGTSAAQSITLTIAPNTWPGSYDFNSSQANFESTFNETTGWGTLWNATSGVSGGGGLATDSSERAALLPDSLITFSTAGQRVVTSVAFKARVTAGATNTAGGIGLRIGINILNTPLLASGGYLVAGLNSASSNSITSALMADSRNNTPGASTTTGTDALTLADNNWYRLDATFTYTGGDSFSITTQVYDLGSAGTSTATLIDAFTVTRSGLTSLVNVPVYVGLQGRSAAGAGGVRTFDNFSATTPPNSPVISSGQATSGTSGTTFSYQIVASNSPTSYALSSGTLPSGVSLNTATGLISGTPTASGTFTPSITATNSGGTSPGATVTLTIVPAPTGVATFRTTYGLASNGSQDLLNPAGDGVQNLLKYAFNMLGSGAGQGSNLSAANSSVIPSNGSAGLPLVDVDGTGKLRVTYVRRKNTSNSGITYAVEFSDTLANGTWAVNASATTVVTSIDTTFERVVVTDSNTPTKRFVRVKVSSP